VSHSDDPSPSPLLCVIGPTASGKSARAVALAKERDGEVISVDSRQVYRMLDIGTEKTTPEEMQGVPHHLIDIRDPKESYSAGDFVRDAERLIREIRSRGKEPILAGGSHFYFDALLYGLPQETPQNPLLREDLEKRSQASLMEEIARRDPRRAARIDPRNKRRLVRALEIIEEHGRVPERADEQPRYAVEWVILNPERDELRERIHSRLARALESGLIEETARVREYVGDARLNELGLEYRIVGEYLRGERGEESLLPSLSTKVWHYARHQKSWLRRLAASGRSETNAPGHSGSHS
jgi:tRNA dimethylallyltransferase